ncbi:MAG: phage terminase large subunit [Hyphomicrobiales bacterium]
MEVVQPHVVKAVDAFPVKFLWFAQNGYAPHAYQILFHGAAMQAMRETRADIRQVITRFRHLVAGRRGGKTLSAAWEVAFYALHPRQFHLDVHGRDSDEPLWIYVVATNTKYLRASLLTFLSVLRKIGLQKGRDYEFNKTEKIIEFPDGTMIEFRSADDPQSLRGAGLDILWIDEAALLPNREAWDVVRPALGDKLGILITTTTPFGRNWLYDEFWSDKAQKDATQFRVEYTSLDNPHFPKEVWDYERENSHPFVFKREYMASFDAFAGVELQLDWLHYYVVGEETSLESPDDIRLNPKTALKKYMAVDPAISIRDDADDFAMAIIGVTEDNSQAYVLKTFRGHIPFPEQVDLVQEWWLRYQPLFIGVESNAFQAALVQQLQRLPGMPPIVPIFSKAKKIERIMAMAPLFRAGRIRIHRSMHDFIDQWVSWDSTVKAIRDDMLDAVEIAIGLAGILLPSRAPKSDPLADLRPASSLEEAAKRDLAQLDAGIKGNTPWDPELSEFY